MFVQKRAGTFTSLKQKNSIVSRSSLQELDFFKLVKIKYVNENEKGTITFWV
jgi:hypothetical protein